jgi:hypothetical protein
MRHVLTGLSVLMVFTVVLAGFLVGSADAAPTNSPCAKIEDKAAKAECKAGTTPTPSPTPTPTPTPTSTTTTSPPAPTIYTLTFVERLLPGNYGRIFSCNNTTDTIGDPTITGTIVNAGGELVPDGYLSVTKDRQTEGVTHEASFIVSNRYADYVEVTITVPCQQ